MKPTAIIAIIFSITIVLAGIGIAAMSGAVETLPVTPAQQMNVESDSASALVDSYIQKESEETPTPLQNYIALQQEKAAAKVAEQTTADESAYYGIPNTNPLLTSNTPYTLKSVPTYARSDNCDLDSPQTPRAKYLESFMTGDERCRFQKSGLMPVDIPQTYEEYLLTSGKITLEEFNKNQEEWNENKISERLRLAENFRTDPQPFILEVIKKKKTIEQNDLENTVAIIITGQLQDKGYTTFTIEGVFQGSSMNTIIDGYDPVYLTQGNQVNVIPLDYGFKNNNQYTLTAINGGYSTSITWTPLP